jgi:hypothetical protein
VNRTDVFKRLTGGDTSMCERKYGHLFPYCSGATMDIAAN